MIDPRDVPELETRRLLLRKWRREDAADMFAYSSDVELAQAAMWKPHATMGDAEREIEDALARYERREWIYWGIERKDERKLIGSIGFVIWREHDRNGEIGYALHRDHWNQGVMTEAVAAVIEFARDVMNVHRLEARCLRSNLASLAVLRKHAFEYEGVRREAALTPHGFEDVLLFGKLWQEDER